MSVEIEHLLAFLSPAKFPCCGTVNGCYHPRRLYSVRNVLLYNVITTKAVDSLFLGLFRSRYLLLSDHNMFT